MGVVQSGETHGIYIHQTYNAISYAGLLFCSRSGMSLIFGVMKIINVAHGAFYLAGGYIGYVAVRWTGNFYLGIAAACVGVGIIGMATERTLLRAWRDRRCARC